MRTLAAEIACQRQCLRELHQRSRSQISELPEVAMRMDPKTFDKVGRTEPDKCRLICPLIG